MMAVRHQRRDSRRQLMWLPILLAAALFTFAPADAGAQISIEIPTTIVGWNAHGGDGTQFPDVAVSTDGTVVFIWTEFFSPRIAVTHAYSVDGIELAPPVQISTSGKPSFTGIASDLRGGFIASWDWNENNGNDYIIGRRLDGMGRGVGTQMVVNVDRPTNSAGLVRAAGTSFGSVFMWEQGVETWLRTYDSGGNSLGPSTAFSSPSQYTHVTNDVVPLSDGGFVLAWADFYAGGTWARLYNAQGQARGPKFLLSNDFDMQRATSFPGGWAIIGTTSNMEWSSPPPRVLTPNRIIVQRFDNQGVQVGADLEVENLGLRQWAQTDLAVDSRGNLYATWITEDWDASADYLSPPFARAFDANGNPYGPPILVSDKRGYDVHPKALPDGNIVSVWEGQGNFPYEQNIYATWVRVCAEGEVCEAPPTLPPTATQPPTSTPNPTSTPVPTPGCGDGMQGPNEECDDGNGVNGDGCDHECRLESCGNGRLEGDEECDPPDERGFCRSDCTRAPLHDSVMVPEKPIDVVIPAGQSSVTKIVPMQVRNADIEPKPERPGHVIRLVASDGDCPPGTVRGLPDFEQGREGDQDSILVAGGTPKTAHVVIFASHLSFPKLDTKIPTRCTLLFTAETLIEGNVDPTPENNTITVELNVRAAKAEEVAFAADLILEPGFFIRSLKPLKVKIGYGRQAASKPVKIRITNGLPPGSPDRQVGVSVDDGTCPAGTVVIGDFAGVSGGGQVEALAARKSVSGKLIVTTNEGLFTSANSLSPGRCTATLIVSDPNGSDERANQRTALMIEASDVNDYAP